VKARASRYDEPWKCRRSTGIGRLASPAGIEAWGVRGDRVCEPAAAATVVFGIEFPQSFSFSVYHVV